MKKFITQQETLVPPERRRKEQVYTVKVPKKRGRKKSIITVGRFLFLRKLAQIRMSGAKLSREEFAAALGIDPRTVNTMAAAFIRTTEEEDERLLAEQNRRDETFVSAENVTAVPLLKAETILKRDFDAPLPEGTGATYFPKEKRYGKLLHYFAFVMPDNCMVMDGVCAGDRIVAARNLRPCHGDLVACRIPGLKTVTVRRFAGTCNPSFFDLYEGGTTNPLFATEYEDLIYGVVVSVQRSYWPGRLPRPWEPVREKVRLPAKKRREETEKESGDDGACRIVTEGGGEETGRGENDGYPPGGKETTGA